MTPASFDQGSFRLGAQARLALAAALALVALAAFGWTAAATILAWGLALAALGFALSRTPETGAGQAIRYALTFAEPAVLTFALWQGDLFDRAHVLPPGMLFFSPAALLLLIPPALAALSTRPSLVLTSGVGVLAAWTAARFAALAAPVTLTKQQVIDEEFDSLIDYLGAITQPRYFDKDVWVLEMVAVAAVAITLAIAAWRTRALAAEAARRRAEASGLEAHFSPSVIEALMAAPSQGPRRLTALDCDLVGFSALARSMAPDEVATALRAYHSLVEAEVFARGGGVLKFTGDGVTAVFGLTGEPSAGASAALACAEALVRRWPAAAEGLFPGAPPPLAVGVEHGEAVAGLAGEGRALALLVVGEPLDRAQSLQAATRTAGAPVLVGQAVLDAAGDDGLRARARPVDAAWALGG